jgi:thymidylate synthase
MNTIDYRYQSLLQDILHNGVVKETRNGSTISVFGRQIRHKMSDGFPLLTTKKMPFKTIVTELLWFLRGDTNIKFLVDNNCHIWDGDAFKNYIKNNPNSDEQMVNDTNGMVNIKDWFINKIKTDDEFAKKWGELGPVYGKQWRHWENEVVNYSGMKYSREPIDQIANLITELKTNPDSRRLMVNAWNVGELDQMVLPPCHFSFQVYTRELSQKERSDLKNSPPYKYGKPANGKLINERLLDSNNVPTRAISLMFSMRSNDVPLGLPFNLASYGLLLEILGEVVNMIPDELIANLGDAHIYLNQIDGVKEQLTREPFELPSLRINTEFWPTQSGECGIGPIDAQAVLNSFSNDDFCKCLLEEDIQLINYQSHPAIKMPLSN